MCFNPTKRVAFEIYAKYLFFFSGQRCSGRNFTKRRCCTPENPCGLGEGDCAGPFDGGANDGHKGCMGNLRCGDNNCKKFGLYFLDNDDCCDYKENVLDAPNPPENISGTLKPPSFPGN